MRAFDGADYGRGERSASKAGEPPSVERVADIGIRS